MDQERIGILLSKLLAGEATLQEQKELESAFRDDPSLQEAWNAIQALKESPPDGLSVEEEQQMLEKGLQRLDFSRSNREFSRSSQSPAIRRFPSYRWMAAAAVLFVLVVAGVMRYSGSKDNATPSLAALPASKELISKYGSRSYIELPDGSKLWLNAGSKVQYAAAFANDKRELTLSGEAYFDVKHDPAHPFIIHTGRLDVKVLGTSFNIKAYPGDSLTETTLIRGKVEVDFTGNTHSAIILKPSEKLIVSTATGQPAAGASAMPATPEKEHAGPKVITTPIIPDPKDGTIEETSWVENKLVFRKEPFVQLALKLERWYNVKIHFDNEKYKMDELTGTFKDQPIDEVMRALQLTSDFHYQISGGAIRIW